MESRKLEGSEGDFCPSADRNRTGTPAISQPSNCVQCPLCDMRFNSADNIYGHLQCRHKIEIGTYRHVCQNCGRRVLNQHLRSHGHDPCQPGKCPNCGLQFAKGQAHRVHEKERCQMNDGELMECRLCGCYVDNEFFQTHLEGHGYEYYTDTLGEEAVVRTGQVTGNEGGQDKENGGESFHISSNCNQVVGEVSGNVNTSSNTRSKSDSVTGCSLQLPDFDKVLVGNTREGFVHMPHFNNNNMFADFDHINQGPPLMVCEFDLKYSDCVLAIAANGRRWYEWVLNLPF